MLLLLTRMAAFSLEDDTALERIPRAFVDDNQARMRCDGDRCSALVGDVGVSTACAVYSARPDICKGCLPRGESGAAPVQSLTAARETIVVCDESLDLRYPTDRWCSQLTPRARCRPRAPL